MCFSKSRRIHPAMFVLAVCALTSVSIAAVRAAADDRYAKLVIKKALYGDLAHGKTVDVTQKLKDAVADSALIIDASNDNFGDPAPGAVKRLKVDYTFDGKDRSKTVDEGERLEIYRGEEP